MNLLLVAFGGALGSSARYILSTAISSSWKKDFPLSIMIVNILGCFVMGLVSGGIIKFTNSEQLKLFVTGGFLAGFTTFSAFAMDSIMLFEKGLYVSAMVYIFSSVIFSLAGLALALFFARNFL